MLGVFWLLTVRSMRHDAQVEPEGRNAALGNAERHEHSERFASAICFDFWPIRNMRRLCLATGGNALLPEL